MSNGLELYNLSCAVPELFLASPDKNADEIISIIKRESNSAVILFPELSLSGYTCGDLFLTSTLQEKSIEALIKVRESTKGLNTVVVVGLPFKSKGRLYNCAALIQDGRILGMVPKTFIPENNEYYEKRWFSSGEEVNEEITLSGDTFRLSARQVFYDKAKPDYGIGIEICEDLWAPNPPSTKLAAAGALIILNPSASDETIAKADYRTALIAQQSARLNCAYLYVSSGFGESSQDLVFSGDAIIAEKGIILARSERFNIGESFISAQVDLESLEHDRLVQSAYRDMEIPDFTRVPISLTATKEITRIYEKNPFVPSNLDEREKRCEEILKIQSTALARRLSQLGDSRMVLGISGGLDSTLALIVSKLACDLLGIEPDNITAVTMPGFGTTDRTYDNAVDLIGEIGARFREIPIAEATAAHFKDIGHSIEKHDTVYENAQARERTQILMDIANQENGIVVGTGDLSELALGWATFNGDHMAMYGVNAGVPKTLVRYLVHYYADQNEGKLKDILYDVLDTPVSPELLPPDEGGKIAQKTEEKIGPYELHDFFLFHLVRNGFGVRKIYELALKTFEDEYDSETILKWLETFLRRFFTQQYKRSTLPDGPKVGSVTLSPRGDWRMPPDSNLGAYLEEIETIKRETKKPD